ncbi:MAG: SIR2 family protein [Candidatus Acidiferrales bacterium]
MLIESQENLKANRDLIEAIRSDSTVAFAGAGVSARLGYPDWTRLINELADEAEKITNGRIVDKFGAELNVADLKAMNDPLVSAEIIKLNLGTRYGQLLGEIFAPRYGASADIVNISRIPFQHILTSNYDISLELAHNEVPKKYESFSLEDGAALRFLSSIGDYRYSRCIVHVHGRYDDPQSIVLTNGEYARIYQGLGVCRKLWETLPLARKCVFFGFSFSDQDIAERFSLGVFHDGQRSVLGTRHFALVELVNEREEVRRRSIFRERYGIEPVFFSRGDASYRGYSEVVAKLASATATLADDVERLKALTRVNIQRTKTGDL